MRGRIFKSFALTVVLVMASVLLKASPAPSNRPLNRHASSQDSSRFTLQGKITKVESGKLTVNTEENILFHVRYDDKTEITRADGSAGSEKDLRAGLWVEVEGNLEESGEIAAATIKLQEQKTQKH